MPKEEWWLFYESFLKRQIRKTRSKTEAGALWNTEKCEGSSGMDGIYGSGNDEF